MGNMVVNHLFDDDICVFSPSISRLLDICDDHDAQYVMNNCNKTTGVLFYPKMFKQPTPLNVFLNGVHVQFSDQVKYLSVLLNEE